ncbi:nuclear transport factor 2 family protein [Streptomyces sp. NPDC060048]|uniref:nuclear transport factor 2 family protein n=1 Tax=unclassified Streptomyces TaxID=2593676 RepID=UPI0036A08750
MIPAPDSATGQPRRQSVRAHPRSREIRGIDELVGFMRRAEVEGDHTRHLTSDPLADVDGDQAAASANSLVRAAASLRLSSSPASARSPTAAGGGRRAGRTPPCTA